MKNWKTTLIGLLGAIWVGVEPIITSTNASINLSTEWPHLVGAVIVAALGFVAKDFDVTGIGNTATH